MGVKPIVWPLARWCYRNGCETHCLGRWPDGVIAMGVKPIVWAVGPMVLSQWV